jgi:hypothetical protein
MMRRITDSVKPENISEFTGRFATLTMGPVADIGARRGRAESRCCHTFSLLRIGQNAAGPLH